MKSILGAMLIVASIGWATPLPVTGNGYKGTSFGVGIHVNGDNGFTFNWTLGFGLGSVYLFCVADQPCDASGGIAASFVSPEGSFFASDGSTSVGENIGAPGLGAFDVKWIAPPFHIDQLAGPVAKIVVPITIFGTLQAWTAGELASNSAPFFDYSMRGTGTLSGFANVFYDNSSPSGPVVSAIDLPTAFVDFSGTVESVPEPASWLLALPIAVILLYRRAGSTHAASDTKSS